LIDPENLRAWQQTLGYVPQTVYLADDTIASNIARRPQIADLVAMA
jgi:ABC-type protease/lipase transport system fused ATPase/permease subunit